jgi:hypothetical protein
MIYFELKHFNHSIDNFHFYFQFINFKLTNFNLNYLINLHFL